MPSPFMTGITGIKYYLVSGYYRDSKGNYLHHEVLPKKDGYFVDHINGDTTDNRRENLRYVTPQQNTWNSQPSSSTGYKNVHVDKSTSKPYKVQLRIGDRNVHIGRFFTSEEAAYVADQFMMQLHGEYAVLNFEY